MKPVVLITGGLGYVGGRLARRLLRDNSFTIRLGTRSPSKPLPAELSGATGIDCRLESAESLAAACDGVDTVIHLAAVNEVDCATDPALALEINTAGTLRLVQAATKAGVRRFIYFSTAHVYGAPLIGRITEETVCRPVHPYAWSHKAAEDIVLAAKGKTFEPLVLRLANAFGAPVTPDVNRWTLLVNDLCKQAVANGCLTLKSSGSQERNFITLTDVEAAVSHLLAQSTWAHDIVNLGGGRSLSVLAMTQLIAERAKATLKQDWRIERPSTTDTSPAPALDFSSDRLAATGFAPSDNFSAELDGMLLFCQTAFGKKAH